MSTGALAGIAAPAGWKWRDLWSVAPRVKEMGSPELPPLSVYLEAGVVPRNSRSDNHNQLGEDLSRYLVVQPNDIVFNKLRTWQGGFGMSKFEGIVSPAYFVCRPAGQSTSRFLHYLLRSNPYLAELKRISKWMPPSQFDIPWDMLRKLPLLLPPTDEQRRVADFLDAETARIDRSIAAAIKGRNLLDERRWGTVHALSAGVETPGPRLHTGLGWIKEIPEHWRLVPLKFVASLGSGHTPSRRKPEYWESCTIPWISLFDVGRMRDVRQTELVTTQQTISELGVANSSANLHPAGTVVLSRTASVGFSTIMGVDMAVSQHFVTWTCGKRIVPMYLLMLLRSMRQYFESVQVGTTNVTVFMPDLYAIKIPLPPVPEQHQIVKRIQEETSRIDVLAERFDRQLVLLKERRQALITAAVTGQFDVSTASGRNVTDGVTV
ncbi:restriction endonuclease subunit S [Streptomyces sp. NPDC048197]|uniref:restriction endonuclease subunit S n=1 Tax=Streptomyces sp. NPDC048197 TaxID=3365511 RepID=UPI00371CC911